MDFWHRRSQSQRSAEESVLVSLVLGRRTRQTFGPCGAAWGQVIKVGRFFPSSKTCHCCGWQWEDMDLSDRISVCQNPWCAYDQFLQDRDHNAGLNILREALRLIGLIDQVVDDIGSGAT